MKVLTALLVLVSPFTYGQKSKNTTIFDQAKISVVRTIYYDESNTPMDTSYYMMGVNAKYQHITDIISLHKGEIAEMTNLFKKCLESFNEDAGTSLEVGDNSIYVEEYVGIKAIMLFGIDDDSRGYVNLNKNQVTKILQKLETYVSTIK